MTPARDRKTHGIALLCFTVWAVASLAGSASADTTRQIYQNFQDAYSRGNRMDPEAKGSPNQVCAGSIAASPHSGFLGDPVNLSIQISVNAAAVTRVEIFANGTSQGDASGGNGHYSKLWLIGGGANGTVPVEFVATGGGKTLCRGATTVRIRSSVAAVAACSPPVSKIGDTVTCAVDVSGGTPPYTVELDMGGKTSVFHGSATHYAGSETFTLAGTHPVRARVDDSGNQTTTVRTSFTVTAPALSVQLSAVPNPALVNESCVAIASIAGGTPPFSCSFNFGGAGIDSSGTASCSASYAFSQPGTVPVSVAVTDQADLQGFAATIVVVQSGTCSPPACCPSNPVACDAACITAGTICCPGMGYSCTGDFPVCCGTGNGCCPANTTCCGEGCCPNGQVCAGNGCCPQSSPAACPDGVHCCPDVSLCAGACGCCPAGTHCGAGNHCYYNVDGARVQPSWNLLTEPFENRRGSSLFPSDNPVLLKLLSR